ncbi:MAG TPA: DNA mismatch repair protein MutS [Flavobacteriales bacterium]|nr:DNA mismatch repair protein MutS [Flavobacteriales bacterium]
MKQFNGIKAKFPDALLLFRVGDFYETFGDDAIKASKILGITLTKRNNGSAGEQELAGFPHHSLDLYLPKLVRAGLRVAVCDQLEDPKMTKTIVKRGVTELVTPGVSYNDKVLENKFNSFLAAVHFGEKNNGVSFLDVSTGEFLVAEGSIEYIDKLLQSFKPNEVLYQKQHSKKFMESFGDKFYTYKLDDWVFSFDYGFEKLAAQFATQSLKGFGVDQMHEGVIAAGVALHYLFETQHDKVSHITNVRRIHEDKFVWLDKFTIRNLELVYSANENAKTLIDVLDHTITPMGSRMLKRWVVMPLKDLRLIEHRHKAVDYLVRYEDKIEAFSIQLEQAGDLERLISKAAVGRINPREMVCLKRALETIEPVQILLKLSKNDALQYFCDQMNTCKSLVEMLNKHINDDAPVAIHKGGVIKPGVNAELDELRELLTNGREYLQKMLQREIEATGITSLKIGFNNVFGYYIEVSNTHKTKAPSTWIRKQTLANAERYVTEELKEYETKILNAEENILALETRLFNELVSAVQEFIVPIQHNAHVLAQIDCLLSFAICSSKNGYTRPLVNDSKVISIKDGRHPVIELCLPDGQAYIANDIYLDDAKQQIMMITGPNMAGKSALLRQTALIVLLAQIGCFVPAKAAEIGVVDKIFTRVGASDNLSSGESTFMVEMNETASILNNVTDRSLVLLDEIGRGTSTYDGISIAWAIAEYLHENQKSRGKTLFATHYHELNEMSKLYKRIKNFNVSVKEVNGKIIFMRKVVPGGSQHSFGIHVAKLAGMPVKVVRRAEEMLHKLESTRENVNKETDSVLVKEDKVQLSFFQLNDPVLEQIKEQIEKTDIDTLTPVEALIKLNEIKKAMGLK